MLVAKYVLADDRDKGGGGRHLCGGKICVMFCEGVGLSIREWFKNNIS
jgi:hypothetical protein